MKKSILNLGKTLNKKEQKNINGGILYSCSTGYSGPRCPVKCFMGQCFL